MSVHVEEVRPAETGQRPTMLSWIVAWAAMIVGIAASLAANVAHAVPTVTGRMIAGWAPVALLLVVEVLAHTPKPRFWLLAWARYIGTAIVAGVAATASYRHMRDLAFASGEDLLTASTLPLSADGLILVSSVSLMVLAHERRLAAATKAAPLPPLLGPMPSQPQPVPPMLSAAVDPLPPPERVSAMPDPVPVPDSLPVPLPEPAASVPAERNLASPLPNPDPMPLPSLPKPLPLPLPDPRPTAPAGSAPWPRQPDSRLPEALVAGLDRYPDETRKLFERAYRLVLHADATGRSLTGAQLGAQCARGERWGRDRLREVRTAVRGRTLSGVP